ncbi:MULTISPECIES: hypothetical protein [unclassified Paludibacterium]|uniref:winged helix-turn-helix domain-containing protein n=1 Tax=unclassified Paludibacterium TaxID=2618429 RepID=UPI001C04B0E5|nr:hypothetical protein [Paludibacterium sp. B53371]BEV70901.1 hypothetical protein THUN1379_03830 [Paludibacterium sp. THUN1379]
MALPTDYSPVFVLEGQVLYDAQRRYLSRQDQQVELKEHEARLLSALLSGVQSKREIIALLWESRGVIVTENNYYKVVKGLRNAFEAIGLSADLLKTLPRIGIAYVGTAEVQGEAAPAAVSVEPPPEVLQPVEVPPPAAPARRRPHELFDLGHWGTGLLIALLAILCGWLMFRSDNGFRLLGASEGVKVYVYKDPGIALPDVLRRYRQFSLGRQDIRYVYYRAVGKNYIILACPTSLPDGAESCISLMQKNL